MIVATALLMLALTWGGVVYRWASLIIVGLICASVLVFSLFARQQMQRDEPLLPMSVLGNPIIAYGSVAIFFAATCPVGLSAYFPVYLRLIENFGAAASGLALIALVSGALLGSAISARCMRNSLPYKRLARSGCASRLERWCCSRSWLARHPSR